MHDKAKNKIIGAKLVNPFDAIFERDVMRHVIGSRAKFLEVNATVTEHIDLINKSFSSNFEQLNDGKIESNIFIWKLFVSLGALAQRAATEIENRYRPDIATQSTPIKAHERMDWGAK